MTVQCMCVCMASLSLFFPVPCVVKYQMLSAHSDPGTRKQLQEIGVRAKVNICVYAVLTCVKVTECQQSMDDGKAKPRTLLLTDHVRFNQIQRAYIACRSHKVISGIGGIDLKTGEIMLPPVVLLHQSFIGCSLNDEARVLACKSKKKRGAFFCVATKTHMHACPPGWQAC